MHEEYTEYCAEARWIGQQPMTFTQWLQNEYGEIDPKAAAQERIGNIWDAQDAQEAY